MSRPINDALLPIDCFSRQTLELSIELIINTNPGLADAIKKAVSQIHPAPFNAKHKNIMGDMYFNAQLLELLQAHTIGKIVAALTELGECTLQYKNHSIEYVVTLRKLIDDWVRLTEWVLKDSATTSATQLKRY